MKLLDCTLRDGGYYNDWNFSKELIENYLDVMDSIKIDLVEIGYRFLENSTFRGPCAYSSNFFLESLNIPKSLKGKLGVMINASEILENTNNNQSLESVLEALFPDKSKEIISFVRIACRVSDIKESNKISKWLKNNGYKVCINLMQVTTIDKLQLKKVISFLNKENVDVLYFADSLGSLDIENLNQIINVFKENWPKDIGIHAHDNMGNAVKNSLYAASMGINWIDSTITGMGRGPGNAQTEYLCLEREIITKQSFKKSKLMNLINNTFIPMKNKFGWGLNVYYYLSGIRGIHPSYIQQMLGDSRFSENDIFSVIDSLSINRNNSFNERLLEDIRSSQDVSLTGDWKPETIFKDRDVLILGSGPKLDSYIESIEHLIRNKKILVLALNSSKSINENLIDYRIASHPLRILADIKNYSELPQPIITPKEALDEKSLKILSKNKILNFGLKVQSGLFQFAETSCIIPNSLVLSYALAMVTSGKCKNIMLAGFDGYSFQDPRKKEIDDLFSIYIANAQSVNIYSITETLHDIPQRSIFGLIR